MISLLVFAAAVVCANGAAMETCTVGSWSEWSECTSSTHCPKIPPPIYTVPMEATTAWDSGRSAMQRLKQEKREAWQSRIDCRAAGTCPEQMMRPLPGAHVCENGIAGDAPCLNVDQLSFLTFEEMGYFAAGAAGNDVWGWTDPQNDDEYAIMGFTGGTAFVRITNPINPVPVGFIYSTRNLTAIWRDIKVIGNYAYIVSETAGHGLQVFDLTHLRGRTTIGYFEPDAVNMEFGNAHNIVANERTNYVYVVGATSRADCRGGLISINVEEPLKPTVTGCYPDDGYTHDAQCVIYDGPDIRFLGKEVCFCYNEDSFTIVDVTDKMYMRMIAKSAYPYVAYTHQGWVTEDMTIALLDDEQDELALPANQFTKTYVWDIRRLDDPTLMTIFESSERSIDHNQYIIGDLSYQANYESGLRILYIDRPTYTLRNVGFFDVFPSRTSARFFGSWSVFPWFKSGSVAVSSIDYGLFIVRPDMDKINALIASGTTPAQSTRSRPIIDSVLGNTCPKLVETKFCKAPVLC